MAPDDSGEGSTAVVDSVLRICIVKAGLDTLQSRDLIALHTALLEGGGQECAEAE